MSGHIPKIYDESQEPEIVFAKQNGKAHYNIKKVHRSGNRLVRKHSVPDGKKNYFKFFSTNRKKFSQLKNLSFFFEKLKISRFF